MGGSASRLTRRERVSRKAHWPIRRRLRPATRARTVGDADDGTRSARPSTNVRSNLAGVIAVAGSLTGTLVVACGTTTTSSVFGSAEKLDGYW